MTLLLTLVLALTPAQTRGRHIYRTGESPAGRPMTAVVQGSELGAGIFACANCHGREGRGLAEGNVVPSDIRWTTLQKYAAPEIGRTRPKYTHESLARAIREGVDPAGNPLSPVMPRFRMDDADLADLLSYLEILGSEPQPGLTDDSITIAGSSKTVERYFEQLNAAGGVFGRKLHVKEVPASEAFAVIGPADEASFGGERVPHVAPFPSASPKPASFFLFPGLEAQALALKRHAGDGPLHAIHDGSPAARAAAEALGPVSTAPKTDGDLLFLIGPGIDAAAELRKLGSWAPRVYIAGAAVTPAILDVPKALHRRIFIAVAALPSDVTENGRRELAALGGDAATYAAAKVLVEGLKRAGREVTRETLITALEQLYDFPTEVTPPVTFSRDRRSGTRDPHIVVVDLEARGFEPLNR